jgi:hypothetical protein
MSAVALVRLVQDAHSLDTDPPVVPNHTRHALARIPLRWMIRECFEAQTGLIFDMDRLHYEVGLGIDFNTRECVLRSSSLSH